MKMPKLLPIGSVVNLVNGDKKVMIVGRFQQHATTNKVYDYSSVLWPEGYIDSRHVYLFDHSDIEKVYFAGFNNEEEDLFKEILEEEYEKRKY